MEFDDGKPLEDHEYPEPDDDDDEASTVSCSNCGEQIYDEAAVCPYCGDYVTHSTNVWAGRPFWWLALGAIGVLCTTLVLSCAM